MSHRHWLYVALTAYVGLLFYGTLYPFEWQASNPLDLWQFLQLPNYISKSDVITNALVYIPLGMLCYCIIHGQIVTRIFTAWLLGTLLSFSLEVAQHWLPSRVLSGLDLILNSLGSLAGAFTVAVFSRFATRWPLILPAVCLGIITEFALSGFHRSPVTLAALIVFPLYLYLALSNRGKALAYSGLLGLLSAWSWIALKPGEVETLNAINWMPFVGQMWGLRGLADLVGTTWPFMALAAFAYKAQLTRSQLTSMTGLFLVVLYCLLLEWLQQFIPGRYPDITDVLLAAVGWLFGDWLVRQNTISQLITSPNSSRSLDKKLPYFPLVAIVCFLAAAATTVFVSAGQVSHKPAPKDESEFWPQERLQQLSLPEIKQQRPRLPAPSDAEISRLIGSQPKWYAQLQRTAASDRNPKVRIDAAITAAYFVPGSVDLANLHQELLALQPVYRGNGVVPNLAKAYDWLFDFWSIEQRAALREKLISACHFVEQVISKQQLSPYNVILYNAPLQSFSACAISLYDQSRQTTELLRKAWFMWHARTLPVWRQIMGTNGGWHEGGEYVGIGIGQAIYKLPSIWRSATGIDYFQQEPGIRGFLEFAVQRIRPDGSHFRWGDAGFFDKAIPDLRALALEYNDLTVLESTRNKRAGSTSWPWGPFYAPNYHSKAVSTTFSYPLVSHFDGLGLITGRSNWQDTATYFSFKAGDNYWSHSHLDQGAFTLFKGGALAIDSGLYGPRYGSDHHMNYSYQTIAHNTITVTAPNDTLPLPARKNKPPRPIANDGGQRRVGSGWGRPAPDDLQEWLSRYDEFHTGRIVDYYEQDGLLVAVGDLTPAYTNQRTGRGDFAARTRRVEQLYRYFIYDRTLDVVVIFDYLFQSKAEYRSRWLLHALESPVINTSQFAVTIPPNEQPKRLGSKLQGMVFLPEQHRLLSIGGDGLEFFADGTNYDADGKVWQKVRDRKNNPEPGRWRIELHPTEQSKQHHFLVVLMPRLQHQAFDVEAKLLKQSASYELQLSGRGHTKVFRFAKNGRELMVTQFAPGIGERTTRLGFSR